MLKKEVIHAIQVIKTFNENKYVNMNGRGKYILTTCPRVLNSLFRKGIRTLDEEDKEPLLRLFIFFY